MRDARFLTIFDLCELAEKLRSLPVKSKAYARCRDEFAAAAIHLELSGAMGMLAWWAEDVEPEAPPDAKPRITIG